MVRKQSLFMGLIAAILAGGFLFVPQFVLGQAQSSLTMDDVMTGKELKETGVGQLSPQQRAALDAWLMRYTDRVIRAVNAANAKPAASAVTVASSSCSTAIESSIDGDFEGWDGETIFKLANGQIWQQAEYDYTYSYSYDPKVTIFKTSAGCRMSVEDESETIIVKRIK